jgi:hypothetical protein
MMGFARQRQRLRFSAANEAPGFDSCQVLCFM